MGWHNGMMGAGGLGAGWALAALLWLLVVGAVVLLTVRLLAARRPTGVGPGVDEASERHETPEEMLDRMFAVGKIDEATYRARRTALSQMRGEGSR